MISKEIRKLMESGATIRAIWELGRQLERVHGAENVADMTLGNPVAPPPRELTAALEATGLGAGPPRWTPRAWRACKACSRTLVPGLNAGKSAR